MSIGGRNTRISNYQTLPHKRQGKSSDNATPKYISKNKLHKSFPKKPKIDRTYTKRKRNSKKNLHYIRFAKDELTWAMWIEPDGLGNTKGKTRTIVRSDLTRSSKEREPISFLNKRSLLLRL